MKLSFFNIFYDFTNDFPVVILKDVLNNSFYFRISAHTAEDLIHYTNNKNSVQNNVFNIIIDLLKNTEAKIEKLTVEKYENNIFYGYFQIKLNDKLFYYYLSSDDIIILSKMFDICIEVEPSIFYDFIEESKTEYRQNSSIYQAFMEN